MKVDGNLNLVFPVRWGETPDPQDDKKMVLVPLITAYHLPISQAVWEANWRIISATAGVLLKKGVGPRILNIASLALKDAGRADAQEYGLPEGLSLEMGGTAASLLAELNRLTTILAPTANGFEPLPVNIAIQRGIIDADDWADAESALVYFTCGLSSATRQDRTNSASLLALALMGFITSLSVSEYIASLPKSTMDAASPPPEALSTSTIPPAAEIPQ